MKRAQGALHPSQPRSCPAVGRYDAFGSQSGGSPVSLVERLPRKSDHLGSPSVLVKGDLPLITRADPDKHLGLHAAVSYRTAAYVTTSWRPTQRAAGRDAVRSS